jgi:putative membrane protein
MGGLGQETGPSGGQETGLSGFVNKYIEDVRNAMQRLNTLKNHFNWRMLLMRILVNALALLITGLLVPTMDLVDATFLNWFLLAALLGVFNAVVKPIIQFATLRFIFATYGLVVVLINAAVLLLISWVFPGLFQIGNLLWALVAGALIGLVSAFLENLFGLTPPILSEKYPELRRRIRERETGTVKAQISETAAGIILPAQVTGKEDAAAEAAAVLAAIDADSSAPSEVEALDDPIAKEA